MGARALGEGGGPQRSGRAPGVTEASAFRFVLETLLVTYDQSAVLMKQTQLHDVQTERERIAFVG